MTKYVKLNSYYISISNENEKIGVCMDIVDTVSTWATFKEILVNLNYTFLNRWMAPGLTGVKTVVYSDTRMKLFFSHRQ